MIERYGLYLGYREGDLKRTEGEEVTSEVQISDQWEKKPGKESFRWMKDIRWLKHWNTLCPSLEQNTIIVKTIELELPKKSLRNTR